MRVRNKAVELAARGLLSDGAETFLLHNLPSYVPIDPESDEFRGVIRRSSTDRIKVEWRLDGKEYSLSELALKIINKYRVGTPRPSAAGPHHWGTRRESYADWADRLVKDPIHQLVVHGSELQIPQKVIMELGADHVHALRWFDRHAGMTMSLPRDQVLDIYLVNQRKGIHKPKDWDPALSVRQTLRGQERYPDKAPIYLPDGSWIYEYHEEVIDGRNDLWTNKSLHFAMNEQIPVGVLRQQENGDYQILGIGMPTSYKDGYFRIIGMPPGWMEEAFQLPPNDVTSYKSDFDVHDETDRRKRATIELALRRGQGKFRRELDRAYQKTCAISSTSVRSALQAAHILPYRGDHTNKVVNGILLRADWHGLFDAGLLFVDADNLEIRIASELADTTYMEGEGRILAVPDSAAEHPSIEALKEHRKYAERNATYD